MTSKALVASPYWSHLVNQSHALNWLLALPSRLLPCTYIRLSLGTPLFPVGFAFSLHLVACCRGTRGSPSPHHLVRHSHLVSPLNAPTDFLPFFIGMIISE